MSLFCILLAPPRSGTTVLGEAVTRSFGAAWPKEIFHSDFADSGALFRTSADPLIRYNFFNYRQALFKERPELSYPSKENQRHILEGYLEYLSKSGSESRFLLDIKYSSWHHLDSYWHYPGDRPHLARIVSELDLPVVHLKRRNLFALYCSQRFAEQTGVWWLDEARRLAGQRLTIDVADCARYLNRLRSMTRKFDNWLSSQIRHTLEYEELFVDGFLSPRVEEVFSNVFGEAAIIPLSTRSLKVTPPLRSIIANADAVLHAFRATEYRAMVEEALG